MKPIIVILLSLLTVTAFSQKKKSDSPPPISAFDQQLNSALKLAEGEQYEVAEQAFEELLKKEPANGDIYYYYGETVIKDYLSDTLSNSMKDMSEKANAFLRKAFSLMHRICLTTLAWALSVFYDRATQLLLINILFRQRHLYQSNKNF